VSVTRVPAEAAPLRRRRRPPASLVIGCCLTAIVLVAAIWFSIAPPYPPNTTVADPLQGPSADHLLGTDNVGRDVLTRLVLAARTSLLISGAAAAMAAVIGTAVGVLSGYLGGWVDAVLMRIVDALLALPAILLALVVGVVIGIGPVPLIIALGLIFAPGFARVMRAPALALRRRDFVAAARNSGVRAPRIAVTHVLPNSLTPMLVQFAAVASTVVLLEASLSYLGQGVPAPEPSAGRMISEAQRFMYSAPLLVISPAVLLVWLSASWNLMADGVQSLFSPRRGTALPGRRPPRITITRSARTDPGLTHYAQEATER